MAKAWKVKGIKPQKSYRRNAKVILAVKVEEVFSWAPFIRDVKNVHALHNIRISVKRLRYSMEFFSIIYGEEFSACIRKLADLQELLGDIHDCDVIGGLLAGERQQVEAVEVAGIDALAARYAAKRAALYRQFLKVWSEKEKTAFKKQLLQIIKGKESM